MQLDASCVLGGLDAHHVCGLHPFGLSLKQWLMRPYSASGIAHRSLAGKPTLPLLLSSSLCGLARLYLLWQRPLDESWSLEAVNLSLGWFLILDMVAPHWTGVWYHWFFIIKELQWNTLLILWFGWQDLAVGSCDSEILPISLIGAQPRSLWFRWIHGSPFARLSPARCCHVEEMPLSETSYLHVSKKSSKQQCNCRDTTPVVKLSTKCKLQACKGLGPR